MSLSFNLNKDKIQDTYNSLVKLHKKNIQFFATPTNETYRVNSYNSFYDREYDYKFCYTINGKLSFTGNLYKSTDNLSCIYYKNTGELEIKNANSSGSVAFIQNTYTNVSTINSPHLTFENYGGVYTNVSIATLFFISAFIFIIFIMRNIMPKLR